MLHVAISPMITHFELLMDECGLKPIGGKHQLKTTFKSPTNARVAHGRPTEFVISISINRRYNAHETVEPNASLADQ